MSLPTSSDNTASILKLPPEIFPLVASHLPLQLRPPTLSAFAHTSRDVYSYVQPVLYRKVIIKNVGHALDLLERISEIGALVWELHIRLDLSAEIQLVRNTRESVFVKLQEVVEKGQLPQLKYLRLVILTSRDLEDDLVSQYHLPRRFWKSLRKHCPLLQGLCLDGVGDSAADPWIEDPMFYDMKDFLGLRTLDFKFDHGFPTKECSKRLFQSINNLSSSLQSLTLWLNGPWESTNATLVFSITLPNLISFDISGLTSDETTTTEEIMSFWARHTRLERVSIVARSNFRCFSDGVQEGLLPRLSHLKARFKDVRALESHLGQLEHLSISHSINFQVPYLLRSVLPGGLPRLKCLEVNSCPCNEKSVLPHEEGRAWYETEDGQFREETKIRNIWKVMEITFINSIVRGAPNLEELCLHCVPILTNKFVFTDVSMVLGRLKSLERFFYRAFGSDLHKIEQTDLDDFLLRCRMLGNSCGSLRTVTDVSFHATGPYLKGTIIRECGGSVADVVAGRGFGMEFTGGGDDPFPLNPESRPPSY